MRKVLFIGFAILLAVSLAGYTIFRMPGATLHGRVLIEGIGPASNAKVTFIPASDYGSSITGYTAADGTWTTDKFAVKPDGYTIKFEHPDAGEPSTITYKVCLPFKTYDVGDVTLWADASSDTVSVTGTIIDIATTDPIEDVEVTFEFQGSPAYTVIVTTGTDGTFEAPVLPAGTYDITFTHPLYLTITLLDEDLSIDTDLGEIEMTHV